MTGSGASDPGALFERMAELERSGRVWVSATVVRAAGSSPRHVGARMVVLADGTTLDTLGGGVLEKRVTEDALALMDGGQSALKEYRLLSEDQGGIGGECGGEVTVFLEVRGQRPRLVVVGGGHVGLALVRAALPLGFACTVVDGREEFSDAGRFPPGTATVRLDPADDALAAQVPDGAFVVILTHSHVLDRAALEKVLAAKAAYVGMIGSRRKVKALLESLAGNGVPRERLAGVHAPVGLDIGAETPEEIALSILAEIVHVRRKGGSSPASLRGA